MDLLDKVVKLEKSEEPSGDSASNSRGTSFQQLSDESSDRPQDRRIHPRFSVDSDSTLLLVSHGVSLPSRILDLSLEGCRLRTRERYAVAARARVEVAFKVNGIAFRFLGVIQWTDSRHCAGVCFVDMIARRREELAEVIAEIESVAAAKEAKAAAEREARNDAQDWASAPATSPLATPFLEPPEHAMENPAVKRAAELAAWEAREWAKIQQLDATPKAPGAPKPAPPAESSSPAPTKRDRRAQSRHPVDTTAAILLIKIGSRLGGRIIDLSAGGCRILCDERFPVGIYTRVETEFRLEGLPFRLGGVIQAIHDRRTVGIRFLDLSGRKREQIEQLIDEIEAARALPPAASEATIEGQS